MSEWIIRPYPLSETFFAERLRGCDYACSAEVYSRLRDVDVIDAHGFAKWHKCENCWCAALRFLSTFWKHWLAKPLKKICRTTL